MSYSQVFTLQSSATANGNGTGVATGGYDSALQLEIVETGGGTCTLTVQGSFDGGSNWYTVGYQRVDGQTTLTRAASGISVGANTARVYQLLDPYPQMRAVISSIAGGGNVTVRLFAVP